MIAVIWATVIGLVYLGLHPRWPAAERWLLLSGLTAAYALWVLWRHLPSNYDPALDQTAIRPKLGYGNGLTIFRALCLCLIAGFMFGPWPPGALGWAIALTYSVAAAADFLDGYVARITGHVTELGGVLDMEYDGLAMVVVTLLAVSFGQLPWWYLLLGFARYLFVAGLWLRERLGLPVYPLQPSVHRRVFAGFQMGFMAAAIWPIVPAGSATLAGVTFGTLTSVGFLRDWGVVIGRIDPTAARYRRFQRAAVELIKWRLTPVCRLIVVIGMVNVLGSADPSLRPAAWVHLFAGVGLPVPAALATLIALAGLIGAIGVGAGALARLSTFAVIIPLGLDMWVNGVMWLNGVTLVAALLVMALGPGRFAVWPVEERFVERRAGE